MAEDRISSWSCEVGVVSKSMIPDGGDAPLRNVVTECWDRMFPGESCSISSGWGPVTPTLPTHSKKAEANLGCATTEEMLLELIARFTVGSMSDNVERMEMTTRAVSLGIMLGGLSGPVKEYRTVDDY